MHSPENPLAWVGYQRLLAIYMGKRAEHLQKQLERRAPHLLHNIDTAVHPVEALDQEKKELEDTALLAEYLGAQPSIHRKIRWCGQHQKALEQFYISIIRHSEFLGNKHDINELWVPEEHYEELDRGVLGTREHARAFIDKSIQYEDFMERFWVMRDTYAQTENRRMTLDQMFVPANDMYKHYLEEVRHAEEGLIQRALAH